MNYLEMKKKALLSGVCTGQTSLLPSGYRQIEYIESTGTQWIDTGVKATYYTGFCIDFITYDSISTIGNKVVFGAKEGPAYSLSTYSPEGKKGTFTLGYVAKSANMTPERQTISLRSGVLTDPLGNESKFSTITIAHQYSIPIFAYRNNGAISSMSSVRLFSMQFYQGEELIRDFIPCLDHQNTPCLYDTVSKQTFYNQGTGEFLYKEKQNETV